FRLAEIYAPYVGSSLEAIDGIDVEDTPDWRARASRCNRKSKIEPAPIRKELSKLLRPYQKTGIAWLRFLENSGFCGLLADEMGLGKTVQTLAWMEAERISETARGKPSLIVCPTSLVENWVEEAQKFTPSLRLIPMTGPERKEKWAALSGNDIGVTSYALLRRDVELAVDREFSIVILDEAQHIKNRSTRNAVAAKKLRAEHRAVLTGTPVENSVADLWSIMDFLMPGYLGSSQSFRSGYELPIAKGADEGALAASRLKRKLHPFLLRRLKKEVATDLPAKIERISTCTLTRDQQTVYRELLESSRRRISDMVAQSGFEKSRMQILTTLMRLRQVCCHLGLLKLPGLDAKYPSAKMELFFELLDEALDSGHRVLVFSQFVSMLSILREEMEARDLTYCYLDGSTKDRMRVVHRFNTERDIPAFLISLKAGGTGLNLTGADMVVHFDPWWNPAVENQATDRAYRIGQKRTVYSVKLITKGTIEEKVLALQRRKQTIIDATVETDGKMAETLTWEDIQELLTF
ncbi:MAG: DEAD/DEAH box helicase, partial [Lentisphaerae bacterium]|nr:DEAD/DEAH box helicase [Lentisphaerota bacterium]